MVWSAVGEGALFRDIDLGAVGPWWVSEMEEQLSGLGDTVRVRKRARGRPTVWSWADSEQRRMRRQSWDGRRRTRRAQGPGSLGKSVFPKGGNGQRCLVLARSCEQSPLGFATWDHW